jgi:hypothetical protein
MANINSTLSPEMQKSGEAAEIDMTSGTGYENSAVCNAHRLPSLPNQSEQRADVEAAEVRGFEDAECEEHHAKLHSRAKGVKLLPHEKQLVASGLLADITHSGASAIWLSAPSARLDDDLRKLVYRPMGDIECAFLLGNGILPGTQPYQTIVEGEEGRTYAEKYLRGYKSVDSSPTTVVEFFMPKALVEELFAMQSKNEDGAISHGLGDKGGHGLPLFNDSLRRGESSFRIVLVKRFCYNPRPPGRGGKRR